jgi:hypothetical protein
LALLRGLYADSCHRRERDWVLSEFKAGRSPILIATDVASRGLGTFSLLPFTHSDRPRAVSTVSLRGPGRFDPSRGSYGKPYILVTIRQGSVKH